MAKQDNNPNNRNSPRRSSGLGGVSLQQVFGYPPDNLEPRTNEMIKKSFPVARFFPSIPSFQRGLDLFHIVPAWKQYSKLLQDNGYVTNNTENDGIQLAFLADNFPTDSFTNEYGENFLQKFTNIASEGAASIAQMMGVSSAGEAWDLIHKGASAGTGGTSKGVAKGMEWIEGMGSGVKNFLNQGELGKKIVGGAGTVSKLMAGSRIDFPMVWKSSAFQPSYSMTVRLYNPFPQSQEATQKYIIGPIAAIMLLGVPRAEDSSTYTWPFLHRIECPGLYTLDPGFISNITVIKGGDQQQISLQNRLGIVDVRIDVGSLYSSIIAGSSKVTATRPTVRDYTKIMSQEDKVSSRQSDNKNIGTGSFQSIDDNRDVGVTEFGRDAFGGNVSVGTGRTVGRTNIGGVSPKRAAKAFGEDSDPVSRVSAAAEEVYDKLKDLNPFG